MSDNKLSEEELTERLRKLELSLDEAERLIEAYKTILRTNKLFKNKWLQNDKGLRLMRLQRIVDDAVAGLCDELLETVGLEEQEHEHTN